MLETVISVWVDAVGFRVLERQLTAAPLSVCLSVSNAASGGMVEKHNSPTSQRTQHKPLQTAAHRTVSTTHSTCLLVRLCACQSMYVCQLDCMQE